MTLAFSLFRCFVFPLLVSAYSLPMLAAPFSKQYEICIRDISLDGDLRLACSLRKLVLGGKYGAEVWLEHKLEVLDYGEVRSRFVLHPFETGVFRHDPGSWRWIRPGGGEITFSVSDEVEKSRAVAKPRLWNRIGATGKFRTYERNFVQLWTLTSGGQVICDEGWELYYRNGALEIILMPDDNELLVVSAGKRITAISTGGRQIASARWRIGDGPEQMILGKMVFDFSWERKLYLSSVSDMDGVKYAFSYHPNGLLRDFSKPDNHTVTLRWRYNEQEANGIALPFILAGVGESEYAYAKSGGRIHIDVSAPGKYRERLVATVRYGRVISIDQKAIVP